MKTYNQFLLEKPDGWIAYSDLLNLSEWKAKRNVIITREKNHCQVCKSKCMDAYLPKINGLKNNVYFGPATYESIDGEIEHIHPIYGSFFYPGEIIDLVPQADPRIPHIHHTYYVWRKLPWNYPNESLMLVCHICHTQIHEDQTIPVYKSRLFNETMSLTPCTRCYGTGHLPQFNHLESGLCFRCHGSCFDEWIVPMKFD